VHQRIKKHQVIELSHNMGPIHFFPLSQVSHQFLLSEVVFVSSKHASSHFLLILG